MVQAVQRIVDPVSVVLDGGVALSEYPVGPGRLNVEEYIVDFIFLSILEELLNALVRFGHGIFLAMKSF